MINTQTGFMETVFILSMEDGDEWTLLGVYETEDDADDAKIRYDARYKSNSGANITPYVMNEDLW